ncbi:L,D-transpeptidase family protein [Methylacidiphilum caldifontis]|uniref:L,D-TPase catalytic domain-containing protein n=1 Tax=Methylacidiphilum caldifontis TaxID=2795386 RepID=A0A4Y8PAX8_9BACT|nr:L,D-transpeptidase family protein [Methylacidiphilum caldifontis]QSR88110.1 L,D-transpeptidase family protein [Methylacidiphilum caldifontis]TFE68157.1 hypothetical protein A7Q10_00515 [Methylacidiphilum caldifontis]
MNPKSKKRLLSILLLLCLPFVLSSIRAFAEDLANEEASVTNTEDRQEENQADLGSNPPSENALEAQELSPEQAKKILKQKEKEEKKRLKQLEKEEKKRKEEEKKKEKLEKKQAGSNVTNSQPEKKPGTERVYVISRILPAIWWNVNPSEKVTKLEIVLSEQKLYVYQGGRLAAIAPICSGTKDHPTPVGHFKVINKEILHRSNKYGCFVDSKGKIIYANATVGMIPPAGLHYEPADMPFFLRLTDDGVGLHGGYLPGYAASHGCVRLPKSFAQDLYPLVSLGTPVLVRN